MNTETRDKLRQINSRYDSEEARLRGASRVEGEYLLDNAVAHLYMARHGKFPEKEVLARLAGATATLLAELSSSQQYPNKETANRVQGALDILHAEA